MAGKVLCLIVYKHGLAPHGDRTMTLSKVTTEEERLLKDVGRIQDMLPFQEKGPYLQARGVLDAYAAVYDAYVALIDDTSDGTEALKRALFLQWIAFVEPDAFTGIGALDRGTQHRVLEEVQRRIVEDHADTELIWMLRWYDSMTAWYFDDIFDDGGKPTPQTAWYFEGCVELPGLRRFLRDKHGDIQLAAIFTTGSLDHRGQMGEYWLAMLQSQERRRASPARRGPRRARDDSC